jgi:dTMP kinase
MLKRGMFISLEGVEGCGKSIQAELLTDYIVKLGHPVVQTREPGGTPISERIREMVLDPGNSEMAHVTELLLYLASRAQHVAQLILPALNEGKVVICQRFSDATFAYQGCARGLDMDHLKQMNEIATGGLEPDLTILLDMGAAKGLSRKHHDQRDRLENESLSFHNKVREAYLDIAGQSPERIQVIDANGSMEDVRLSIIECVHERLAVYVS